MFFGIVIGLLLLFPKYTILRFPLILSVFTEAGRCAASSHLSTCCKSTYFKRFRFPISRGILVNVVPLARQCCQPLLILSGPLLRHSFPSIIVCSSEKAESCRSTSVILSTEFFWIEHRKLMCSIPGGIYLLRGRRQFNIPANIWRLETLRSVSVTVGTVTGSFQDWYGQNERNSRDFMRENCAGMVPEREFWPKSSNVRDDNDAIADGIVPVMLLLNAWNSCNVVSCLSEG